MGYYIFLAIGYLVVYLLGYSFVWWRINYKKPIKDYSGKLIGYKKYKEGDKEYIIQLLNAGTKFIVYALIAGVTLGKMYFSSSEIPETEQYINVLLIVISVIEGTSNATEFVIKCFRWKSEIDRINEHIEESSSEHR